MPARRAASLPASYLARAASNGLFVVEGEGEIVAQANTFLATLTLRGFSPRTVRAYAHDLIVFFRWLQSRDLELSAVGEVALLEYIGQQRQQNAKPRSINRRLSTCRLFIRHVTGAEPERGSSSGHYRGRGRDKNLGVQVLRPRRRVALRVKVPRTLVEPLSRDQVRRFLLGLGRYRDLAIVYLMLLCGLRSLEVLLLQIDDVSFDERRLRVRGKGGKERALPLPEILRRLLARYLELERPEPIIGKSSPDPVVTRARIATKFQKVRRDQWNNNQKQKCSRGCATMFNDSARLGCRWNCELPRLRTTGCARNKVRRRGQRLES